MENRLRNLRKTMKQISFNQLDFTDKHRKEIHQQINLQSENEEDVILAVFQLLVQEKTGYELSKKLRSRGIKKYDENEGLLYTLLHRLEQSGMLKTVWDESETKLYRLNDKGKKLLNKAENKQAKKRVILKGLLEG